MTPEFVDLGSSRSKLRPGDVFYCQPVADGYVVGRVIRNNARWALSQQSGNCLLVYFFRGVLSASQVVSIEAMPSGHLSPDNLMFAPALTNNLGWRRGAFKTIGNVPVSSSDVLPVHCFYTSNSRKYFDEFARELAGPTEPLGAWGLAGYKMFEVWIDRALSSPDGTTTTPG